MAFRLAVPLSMLLGLWAAELRAQPASSGAPQPPALSDAVRAMLGSWEFSNADRDRRCTVTFSGDPAKSGMKVEFDANCPNVFPFVREIAGWTLSQNDFLRMLGPTGQPVLDFSEVESGVYEAPRPGEGILFIQSAAAAGPEPVQRSAAQFAGEWSLVRGGKPVCTIVLAETAAGADRGLSVAPPCDPAVTRFAPAAWQLDRNEIVLKSASGQTWRFEEGDNANTWQRVPNLPDPVLMVRK